MLVKDAAYWQARLLITWRRLVAAENGTFPLDDAEIEQLGADLERIERELKAMTPPEKRLANIEKLRAWKATG